MNANVVDLAQECPINGVKLLSGHMAVDCNGTIFVTTEKWNDDEDRFKDHFARPAKPEEVDEWRVQQLADANWEEWFNE